MSLPRIKYLEDLADKLGFTLSGAEDYIDKEFGDVVTLYSKDVEVFVGSIQDLERWFQGFYFARSSTWVGLTDEDIEECKIAAERAHERYRRSSRGQLIRPADNLEWHFAGVIEAKLKEKNT